MAIERDVYGRHEVGKTWLALLRFYLVRECVGIWPQSAHFDRSNYKIIRMIPSNTYKYWFVCYNIAFMCDYNSGLINQVYRYTFDNGANSAYRVTHFTPVTI